MSANPPVMSDLDPRTDRILRMVKARADALQLPAMDDQGEVKIPGLKPNAALRSSIEALGSYWAGNPDKQQAVRDYLSGATEDLPGGWVPSQEPLPSARTMRLDSARRRVAEERSTGFGEFNFQLQEHVTRPIAEFVLDKAQIPVDVAVGAANLIPGVNLTAPNVKRDGVAAILSMGLGKDFKETQEAVELTEQARYEAAPVSAKVLQEAAGMYGTVKGLMTGVGGAVTRPGATLAGKVMAKLGFSATGIPTRLAQGAGSFAGYEALVAQGEQGGAPTLGERGDAALHGAVAGAMMESGSLLGKWALRSILRSGTKQLASAEVEAVQALKQWGESQRIVPVKNESPSAFLNRLTDAWIDAGHPGAKLPAKEILGRLAQAGVEGAGFLGLDATDATFRADVVDAFANGDADKMAKLAVRFSGNMLGVLGMHMKLADIPKWQRKQPVGYDANIFARRGYEDRVIGPKVNVGIEIPMDRPRETGQDPISEGAAAAERMKEQPQFFGKSGEQVYAEKKADEAAQLWTDVLSGDMARYGWEAKPSTYVSEQRIDSSNYSTITSPLDPTGGEPAALPTKEKKRAKVKDGDAVAGEFYPTGEDLPTGIFDVHLPGTKLAYRVEGPVAIPNKHLRKTLGLPAKMPRAAMEEALSKASLVSAMQAKRLLPGKEVSANGVVSDGKKMRTVRMGELLEADIAPDAEFKPAESVTARGRDPLLSEQIDAIQMLYEVMNARTDLRQGDRVLLSEAIETLNTVSATSDSSVAETLPHVGGIAEAIANLPAENAGQTIKALGEMLTVKSPEVALRDLKKGQEGFVDVGAAADVGKRGARRIGEAISDTAKYVAGDQIREIAAKSGDKDFEREAQTVLASGEQSRGRAGEALGEAQKVMENRDQRKALGETVDVGGYPRRRYEALINREIEPANDAERKFVEGGVRMLDMLWNQSVDVGQFMHVRDKMSGETVLRPKGAREKAVLPRAFTTEHLNKMVESDAYRQSFFDRLAKDNPAKIKDPTTGEVRDRTGADFEADWIRSEKRTEINPVERRSAFEFQREIEKVPATHEGVDVLSADPVEAIQRVLQTQPQRNATTEVWGQDISAADRAELAKAVEEGRVQLTPANAAVLGRPGVKERIFQLRQSAPEGNRQWVEKNARLVMNRLMGRELLELPYGAKVWGSLMAPLRASRAFATGLMDLPAMWSDAAPYVGKRAAAKAFFDVVRNMKKAGAEARDVGAMMMEIGDHNIFEVSAPSKWVADMISYADRKLERGKLVVFTKAINNMFDAIRSGELSDWSMESRRQGMKSAGVNKADIDAIMSGTWDAKTEQRAKRVLLTTMASRGNNVERSRMAADPVWRSVISFLQWGTRRLNVLAREVKSWEPILHPEKNPKAAAVAAERLFTRALGLGVTGAFNGALAHFLYSAARGDLDAFVEWYKNLWRYPYTVFFKQNVMPNIVGGSVGQAMRAAGGDERALLTLVEPIGVVANFQRGVEEMRRPGTILSGLWRFAEKMQAIPAGRQIRDMAGFLSGVQLGHDPEVKSARLTLYNFKRLEGIEEGVFPREKGFAFYDAMGSIRDGLLTKLRDGLTPEQAAIEMRGVLEEKVKNALELDTGKSIGSSVRSMQALDSLTAEEKQRFADYAGQDVYETLELHDRLISDVASWISKQGGTNPNPFDDRLEAAAKVAMAGGKNAWNALVDESVKGVALNIAAEMPEGDELQRLAETMAAYPESFVADDTFTESDAKRLGRSGFTHAARERTIYNLLRARAKSQAKSRRQERRAEERAK